MALSRITAHGILGINARNLLYIKPFNPRKAIALADDKLKTKAFLAARGIPVAKIYARIDTREQLKAFDFGTLPDECVLKPNEGFGGEGILILRGRRGGEFLLQGKEPIAHADLVRHIEDILEGRYSLGGRTDTAFFEQILTPHECFARFRPAGLPDIRIIVFNLVPVMAMLRIPTARSHGKANLHLGGIGIGIDLATGKTTFGAQYRGLIEELPHGGEVAGIQIPFWDEILLMSSRIQKVTNIGYIACDITITKEIGPALLEVNARAGLSVQIANLAPLRSRLKRVEGVKVATPEKGVLLGQELFGKKTETAARAGETRPVLGLLEPVSITGKGIATEITGRIAPDQERTVFSPDLIGALLDQGVLDRADGQEGTYRVKFTLGGKKLQTVIAVGNVLPPAQASIGRRDLSGFLLDPMKSPTVRQVTGKVDLRALDRMLEECDRDLNVLRAVKPINVAEERAKLRADERYNPVFTYAEVRADTVEIERRLRDTIEDDSAFGLLLEAKRRELLKRIDLLAARGTSARFTDASFACFGRPTAALVHAARTFLETRTACALPSRLLIDADRAAQDLREALERYGLHDWSVEIRDRMAADCSVGGRKIFIRASAMFSPEHVLSLIAHEIETHVMTAENGDHQPYRLLRRGTAGYLDTQEGLAIVNQNRVLPPYHEKRYGPARTVLGIEFALRHSLAATRRYLREELQYDAEKALTKAMEVKRGLGNTEEPGAFTKGLSYFRGQVQIEKFLAKGGDIRRLYTGKVSLPDLDRIEELPDLEPPLLLPEYLRDEGKK